MPMPTRSQSLNGAEFIIALNNYMAASEAAYKHLCGMYDATSEFKSKPDWIDSGVRVRHADCQDHPGKNLTTVLKCLSDNILHSGNKPVRVAHGFVTECDQRLWICYAELG